MVISDLIILLIGVVVTVVAAAAVFAVGLQEQADARERQDDDRRGES